MIQSPDGIRGKGLAVKQGMLAAKGDWPLYTAMPTCPMRIDDLAAFLPPETTGYDIVIASREAPGRGSRGMSLNIDTSWGGSLLSSSSLRRSPTTKTRSADSSFSAPKWRKTYSRRQRMNGIGFDVELLYIAKRRGYKVKELPSHLVLRSLLHHAPLGRFGQAAARNLGDPPQLASGTV